MSMLTIDAVRFRTNEEIFSLVRRFGDCTLPRTEWTHAAHDIVTTPTGGYHETLTIFWLRVVRSFLEGGRNEGRSLVSLANELAAEADSGLPLRHYTRERLFSPEARAGWVEPDLKPVE